MLLYVIVEELIFQILFRISKFRPSKYKYGLCYLGTIMHVS